MSDEEIKKPSLGAKVIALIVVVITLVVTLAVIGLILVAICFAGEFVYVHFGIGGLLLLSSAIIALGIINA